MKIKRDQITGAILVAMGLVIAVLTSQLKAEMSFAYPGAKFLPYFSAFGLVVCGAGVFIEGTLQKKQDEIFLTRAGVQRAAVAFGILVAYVVLMNYTGFLIATPLMLYATSTLFARGQKTAVWQRVLFAVAATAVVYILYAEFFGVRMPQGTLF